MSLPCCKIEIYDTTDTLIHTITDDIVECYTYDILTTGIGSFKFAVPALKGFTNSYDDIGEFYKAKFYYGYNSNYTHLFSGRILNHSTSVKSDNATRTFTGKGLSEILERRIKSNTHWGGVDAHDIVDEIVTDLSTPNDAFPLLGSDIDADTNELDLTIDSETYFDVLKRVSDYWVSAGTQIKKDFGVNKDGELIWKARPLRTVGVETLADIIEYDLTYDITPSKNNITVFGAANSFLPSTPDGFTESTTGWTAAQGTLSASADHQVGSYSIKIEQATSGYLTLYYTLPQTVTVRDTTNLFFKYKSNRLDGDARVELYAPDSSNRFHCALTSDGNWHDFDQELGIKNMYGGSNPSGMWTEGAGHPNWWNIKYIAFTGTTSAFPSTFHVDGLYFNPIRPFDIAQDATNIAAYGQRDTEIISDSLLTTAECECHSETQLYQQKSRIIRLDPTVLGNTNILVGDRLSITLPLDNISAVDFDVVSVENHYTKTPLGYRTTPHLVDSATTRLLPAKTPLELLQQQATRNRAIITELYTKMVR